MVVFGLGEKLVNNYALGRCDWLEFFGNKKKNHGTKIQKSLFQIQFPHSFVHVSIWLTTPYLLWTIVDIWPTTTYLFLST